MYCLYRKNQNDLVITLAAITGTHKAAEEVRNDMSAKQTECEFAILQISVMPPLKIDLRELVDPCIGMKNVKEVEEALCFH